MGAIDVISPDVPVYMSRDGRTLYGELMKIGEGPFRPLEQVQAFDYEVPVSIGEIKVTGYKTDHDVHGSSAIFVETPDTKLAFSGDIRMHGQNPELNHSWMKAMKEQNLDFLLMEGTTFWPPRDNESFDNKIVQIPEGEIASVVAQKLKDAKGVAFFNFYNRNLERMENLMKAAKEAGRKIVFEPDTAHLARVFFPNSEFLILNQDGINPALINKNPDKYFVQNSFDNIFELIDYKADGSIYIHTNGTPLGAFDPSYSAMQSFLSSLGIAHFLASSAGHGDSDAILAIIDAIEPKTLIPWHSMSPQNMIPLNKEQKVILPELDKWYS